MKKYLLITIVSLLLGNQMAKAQSFEYKKDAIDNRQFEDVCIEYVRDVFNVGNKKITILGMTHYPLPNGNTFVFLRFKWIGMTYYEEHQVPGSLVWSSNKTETIYQSHQIEEARRCGVVVNPNGFVNSWFVIPDNFSIWKLTDDILCFLVDKSVNTLNMTIYNSFKCLDSNGNLVWEPKNDFMAFDFLKTDNNLYIAGEKVGNEVRSLIRVYDIKTGKVINEKIGNNRGICFGLKYGEDGIDYTEYLESNNTRKQLNIPVEANDIAAHRRKIMSSYNQNNASDQVAIGERYLIGKGFEKDEKKAFEWFQKAANQNNPVGLYQLAKCYQKGIGVSQDKAQAAVYYEKSASQHNTDAILSLSDMYALGDGIEKNLSKAVSLKEELAFGGNTNAQRFVLSNQSVEHTKFDISADKVLSLARENYNGRNYEWAKFCYERAISLGNADAMFDYGKWLYEGISISKDCNKALELLSKAGEENNIKAQVLLAHIYAENKGVTPDVKQEMYWSMKAADNGDTESQLKLANAYQDGIGVKKDKKLAFEMLRRAAANGNEDAIKQVVLSYALGNGVKKDMYNAVVWSEKMNVNDQLAIARMFYYGDGVKKNLYLPISIWTNLSKQYVFKAINNMALLYIWGVGVKQDFSEAERLIYSIDKIGSMGYSARYSESQYLLGILREAQGKYQQALDCYRNSSKQEAKQCYDKLNERWGSKNF